MLNELCALNGVSGDESRVRDYLKSKIERKVTDMIEDPYGNLIVRKDKPNKLRILLAAHMDEVGLMITGIDKGGLLKFHAIGIMPHVLMAKRVVIGKDKIFGVIGHKPIHLAKKEDLLKIPETKDLFIDIGAASREEACKSVQIGDYAAFDTEFHTDGDIIRGKAFDNRIGCFILLQLILHSDLPLYYAFTVQEEVGLRGAALAAYRIKPHIAIAIDTTSSAEWPEDKDVPQYPAIGKGPTITVADRSVFCDPELVRILKQTAEKENIPIQNKKPMIGGTDAGAMHVTGSGVRSAVVSTPARYIHSPLSFASKRDIRAALKLIDHSIQNMIRKERLWV